MLGTEVSTELLLRKISVISFDERSVSSPSVYIGIEPVESKNNEEAMDLSSLVANIEELLEVLQNADFKSLRAEYDLSFLKVEFRNINASLNFYVVL